MKITNYESIGLNRVETLLQETNLLKMSIANLREILKTINVSFVIEEANRLQSTMLCELKLSYVQQSQRYVSLVKDGYTLPQLDEEDLVKAQHLTERAFDLYSRMTALKDGNFKGRPKAEQYQFGIAIEDGRYILPLSTKTNIAMTFTADKFFDLFCLIRDPKYGEVFVELEERLASYLPQKLYDIFVFNARDSRFQDPEKVEEFYQEDFEKINYGDNVVLLNSFENLELHVGLGALTSTQAKASSEILAEWGEEASEKAKEVTNRVLGYGHTSISEQARTTFGMMMSMVSYHQQVRHRLPENHRESFGAILRDVNRQVVIPQSIEDSPFHNEYLFLVQDIKDFRHFILHEYGEAIAAYFLLNCDSIKLITSTNARIDVGILGERTCMNAQWEIRRLSIKKLQILRGLSDTLYEKALPSCMTGGCKEGKLTCGKAQEVKKLLSALA